MWSSSGSRSGGCAPARPGPGRRRTLLGAALALALVAAAEQEGHYVHIRPATSTPTAGGTTLHHFAYQGGCFDVATPSTWKDFSKGKVTRFRDPATKCSFAIGRYQASPGASLHDALVDYFSRRAERNQAKAERLEKRYRAKHLDAGTAFREGELLPTTLGLEPKAREAFEYGDVRIRARERGILRDKYLLTRPMVHFYVGALDAGTILLFQGNCRLKAWRAFEPVLDEVWGSIQFDTCAGAAPGAAPPEEGPAAEDEADEAEPGAPEDP